MGKSEELYILKRQRSADAPVNVRHRTGESASVGTMLDLYVQAESPEDEVIGHLDDHKREKFVKGFYMWLERVFDEREREFLNLLLGKAESAAKIGRSLGVEHFSFLQEIQKKAYANTKPLIKLAKLTGWSGAEEFIGTIFERLEQLREGATVVEIIPQNVRYLTERANENARLKKYREENREWCLKVQRKYRQKNREKIRQLEKAWREKNSEKNKEYKRKYNRLHKKEIRLYNFRKSFILSFRKFVGYMDAWIDTGKKACLLESMMERLDDVREKLDKFINVVKEQEREREQDVDAGSVAVGMVRDIQSADVGTVQFAEH